MKLTFLGGADEVGASCTLIEIAGKRLLVDAGIRIAPRANRNLETSQLPDLGIISDGGEPDYILVTHAHTDHTGALPLILSAYPSVPVLMTRPTEALVRVLQKDAQRIMSNHYEEEGDLPLYDEVAVDHLMNAIERVEFNQQIRLGEGLGVTYHVSGHIAGAAMLVLDSTEGTLVMSGDVSKSPQRTVHSVRVPRLKADVLVLESTYGGRLHANREAEEKRLIERVRQVIERGGKVLIPAFALGRAQEVLQILLAYRDQVEAPVYADGMVRAVCQAYSGFPDLLPEAMVRAARERGLFFRSNVQAVTSVQQRQQIATDSEPCVIVASSGMLTGGASQFYAQHLLPEEANAIFITGYQDEEAPGHHLRRLKQDREAGEASLRLGKKTVTARCEVDTYSLSAHADENELIALARAFNPEEVLLVHGDRNARHKLAEGLRQRGIAVSLPQAGSVHEYAFTPRPWALMEQVSRTTQAAELDIEALWKRLRSQAGSYFSSHELAQMWYGSPEQASVVASKLALHNGVFFSGDWRQRDRFRVNTTEQVERAQRLRAILAANPDLMGQLVALRTPTEAFTLGLVSAVGVDYLEVMTGTKRTYRCASEALLWPLGEWQPDPTLGDGTRTQLTRLEQEARGWKDRMLTREQRLQLVADAQPVLPASLVPTELPEGVDTLTALIAVVMVLADDDAQWHRHGLRPQAVAAPQALEQNEARDLALALFPPEARLRRVGMQTTAHELLLTFDFPAVAKAQYAELVSDLQERSGWQVSVTDTINQAALVSAVYDVLPPGVSLRRTPSCFMERGVVVVDISGSAERTSMAQSYQQITGFTLRFADERETINSDTAPTGALTEINTAYAMIRQALENDGLYRTSLKNNEIVLSFITPETGARQQATIDRLSEETGYRLTIHPHPNQQEILLLLRRYAQTHGYQITKGPGLHIQQARITLTLSPLPAAAEQAAFVAMVQAATGYTLVIS